MDAWLLSKILLEEFVNLRTPDIFTITPKHAQHYLLHMTPWLQHCGGYARQ
jgi:hypothetical protein